MLCPTRDLHKIRHAPRSLNGLWAPDSWDACWGWGPAGAAHVSNRESHTDRAHIEHTALTVIAHSTSPEQPTQSKKDTGPAHTSHRVTHRHRTHRTLHTHRTHTEQHTTHTHRATHRHNAHKDSHRQKHLAFCWVFLLRHRVGVWSKHRITLYEDESFPAILKQTSATFRFI